MIFTHPLFKHPKFICLKPVEQTSYLSFKLRDYFDLSDRYQPDVNGQSLTFYTNQVSVSDFYDEVNKIFSPKFNIPRKSFIEGNVRLISEPLRRLFKMYDLEKSFRSCFENYISPIYGKLKQEALEKKHAEAVRVSEHLKYLKEQEKIKQDLFNMKKKEQEEREQKIIDFKKMVLVIGNEWEDE